MAAQWQSKDAPGGTASHKGPSFDCNWSENMVPKWQKNWGFQHVQTRKSLVTLFSDKPMCCRVWFIINHDGNHVETNHYSNTRSSLRTSPCVVLCCTVTTVGSHRPDTLSKTIIWLSMYARRCHLPSLPVGWFVGKSFQQCLNPWWLMVVRG